MIPAILLWYHNVLHHYQEKVGWRDSSLSRRLVLAITDDEYHYALDGRVAAIVKRHDGECHLDDDGFYTHDTLLVIHNTVLWWSSDCILKLKFPTPEIHLYPYNAKIFDKYTNIALSSVCPPNCSSIIKHCWVECVLLVLKSEYPSNGLCIVAIMVFNAVTHVML